MSNKLWVIFLEEIATNGPKHTKLFMDQQPEVIFHYKKSFDIASRFLNKAKEVSPEDFQILKQSYNETVTIYKEALKQYMTKENENFTSLAATYQKEIENCNFEVNKFE